MKKVERTPQLEEGLRAMQFESLLLAFFEFKPYFERRYGPLPMVDAAIDEPIDLAWMRRRYEPAADVSALMREIDVFTGYSLMPLMKTIEPRDYLYVLRMAWYFLRIMRREEHPTIETMRTFDDRGLTITEVPPGDDAEIVGEVLNAD